MKHLILVVEDSDEDFEAFCRVMGEYGLNPPTVQVRPFISPCQRK